MVSHIPIDVKKAIFETIKETEQCFDPRPTGEQKWELKKAFNWESVLEKLEKQINMLFDLAEDEHMPFLSTKSVLEEPNKCQVYISRRGRLYYSLGEYDLAQKEFQDLNKLSQVAVLPYAQIGDCLRHKGMDTTDVTEKTKNFKTAMQYFEKGLALFFSKEGKLKLVVKKHHGQIAALYNSLALLWIVGGEILQPFAKDKTPHATMAKNNFDKAVETEPEDPLYLINRACWSKELGMNTNLAQKDLNDASKLVAQGKTGKNQGMGTRAINYLKSMTSKLKENNLTIPEFK